MKALTLTQPWAWLIAIGAKRFETRSWRTGHIGPVAIHAAKGMPAWVPEAVEANPAIRSYLEQHGCMLDDLPRGAVVAIARLEWAEPTWSAHLARELERVGAPFEQHLGDYGPERWAWHLSNVRTLAEPLPAKGALWLWEWTPPAGFAVPEPTATHGGAAE